MPSVDSSLHVGQEFILTLDDMDDIMEQGESMDGLEVSLCVAVQMPPPPDTRRNVRALHAVTRVHARTRTRACTPVHTRMHTCVHTRVHTRT